MPIIILLPKVFRAVIKFVFLAKFSPPSNKWKTEETILKSVASRGTLPSSLKEAALDPSAS